MFPYPITSSTIRSVSDDAPSPQRPVPARRQASDIRRELDALATVLEKKYSDAAGNNEAGARGPTKRELPGSHLQVRRLRSGTTALLRYNDERSGEVRLWRLDEEHHGLHDLAKRADEYAAKEDELRRAETLEGTVPVVRSDGASRRKRRKTTSTLSPLENLPHEITSHILSCIPRLENAAEANMVEAMRLGGRAGGRQTNTINMVKPVEYPDGLRQASAHIYRHFKGETDSGRKAAHLIRRACDIHRLVTPEQRDAALTAILDDAFAVPREEEREQIDRRLDELRSEIASLGQLQQVAKSALRAEGARLFHQKSGLLPEDLGEVIAAASFALDHLPARSTALKDHFVRIATIAESLGHSTSANVLKSLCRNVGRLGDTHRMAGIGRIVHMVSTFERPGDISKAFTTSLETVLPSMPREDEAFSLLKTLAAVSGRLENNRERQRVQGIILHNLGIRDASTIAGFALTAEVLGELEMARAGGWAVRNLPALLHKLHRHDWAEGVSVAADRFSRLENEDVRTHAARYLLEFAVEKQAPFGSLDAADRMAENTDQRLKYYLIEPLCRGLKRFKNANDRATAFTIATRWVDGFTDQLLVTYALDLLRSVHSFLDDDDRDAWQAWFDSTSERARKLAPA